jgi:hypothetical protein
MTSRTFEDGLLRQFEAARSKQAINATVYLQMMFESSDRHIAKAVLNEGKSLVLLVGMRSEILSPFPKYREERSNGPFNQCDIIGLVPAIALMVEQRDKMIAASAVERDEATRVVMVFEGDDISLLARKVWCFMDRWEIWTRVLSGILEKDLPIELDWREFLAGESGFVTMNWYKALDYETRCLALQRVKLASKALIQSVLSSTQQENYMVIELLGWLDSLEPQPDVVSAYGSAMTEGIL